MPQTFHVDGICHNRRHLANPFHRGWERRPSVPRSTSGAPFCACPLECLGKRKGTGVLPAFFLFPKSRLYFLISWFLKHFSDLLKVCLYNNSSYVRVLTL
jgi:hypothetical protein